MRTELRFEAIQPDSRSVLTVGTFDGVHLGHQAILRYLVARARVRKGPATVVTFDPHPREVIYGEPVPILTTVEEKMEIMEHFHIDRFVLLPFTRELAELPPEEYVRDILLKRIGMQEIVVGYDHHFGKGRKGDVELLRRLGKMWGFSVDVIPPHHIDHTLVSSSRIRQLLLEEGNVREAAKLLGRPYSLYARVVPGSGRGQKLGFPTANLSVEHPRKVIPRRGVYAVWVDVEEERVAGMMNIGMRPTFEEQEQTLEVHLIDFSGDLYGKRLRVSFVERLRDERKFNSVQELVEQLHRDLKRSTEVLQVYLSNHH